MSSEALEKVKKVMTHLKEGFVGVFFDGTVMLEIARDDKERGELVKTDLKSATRRTKQVNLKGILIPRCSVGERNWRQTLFTAVG